MASQCRQQQQQQVTMTRISSSCSTVAGAVVVQLQQPGSH